MYTEASVPRKPGQKARLLTPQYSAVQTPQCLTFYYHMFGTNIGSLNVKVRTHTFYYWLPFIFHSTIKLIFTR